MVLLFGDSFHGVAFLQMFSKYCSRLNMNLHGNVICLPQTIFPNDGKRKDRTSGKPGKMAGTDFPF